LIQRGDAAAAALLPAEIGNPALRTLVGGNQLVS
jgi:hypothetical protein